METPEITVYGFGYVGKAVVAFLERHYRIQIFDPFVEDPRVTKCWDDLRPTACAVICVPTPTKADGTCDIAAIEDLVRRSAHDFYLIKSTVTPGSTAGLAKSTNKQIAFSPEYLGE